MKIRIVQSFKADVPEWIARCLQSVRNWANVKGFDYKFVGDELFDLFPDALNKPDLPNIVKTDYCRLALARQSMNDADVVVWIDADVYIWNADLQLTLPDKGNFSVCHEMWHVLNFTWVPFYNSKFNNAFMAFHGTESVDLLLRICEHRLKRSDVECLMLGPNMLTPLVQKCVLSPVIQRGVGCYGYMDTKDLCNNPYKFASRTTKAMGHPMYGANLVHSHRPNENEFMIGCMNRLKNISRLLEFGKVQTLSFRQPVLTRLAYLLRSLLTFHKKSFNISPLR